jgi:type I restriction enzyme S subunit
MGMSDLPKGWATATLNELLGADGLFSDGDWVESKDQDPDGTNRLLQLADIGDGLFVDKSSRYVNDEKFSSLNCTELKEGDVLIARMPAPLGRACLLPAMPQRCLTVVDVAVFRVGGTGVSNKWLMHFLNSSPVRREMELNSSGTTRKRISRGKLGEILLSVPPIAEQTRIASKLDEILAQVATLKTRIDGVPALLRRFRQSVLIAAVFGRLTEKFREQAKDTQVTLLQHPTPPPYQIYAEDNFTPPSNWLMTALGNLASFQQGLQIAKSERRNTPSEESLPILRTVNYENNFKDDVHYAIINEKSIIAEPEDIILSRTGTVGRVLTGHKGIMHNNSFRINYERQLLRRDYLIYFLESPICQGYIKKRSGKSSQPDLTHKEFSKCPALVPPICEQKEIVRRVEQLFALADQLEARVKEAQARIDRLTHSILAKAFCGELVPQDPNDEPASVLLERIKAQHAAAPRPKRSRRAASLG